MSYDGYIKYGDVELINLSRTVQLADALGIDLLRTDPDDVSWIRSVIGGEDYSVITNAPWYDAGYPPSAEFAGIVPLSIAGLDDSTVESSTTEYITNGGSSGKARNGTLSVVANVALVASTARGAEFGKRWLDRVLTGGGNRTFCSGENLRYFRTQQDVGKPAPAQVHRRDVTLGRGTSVTRKRVADCATMWLVTFTWTANDPFEYEDEIDQFTGLGGAVSGAGVASSGSVALTEQDCPVYDYSPVYDPIFPALVPPPSAPDFYPDGWELLPGVTIDRSWVRLNPVEPSSLGLVPIITLRCDTPVRMVRVSIWPGLSDVTDFCGALWQGVVSYIPPNMDFVIDGEQEAAYVWDGFSPLVRRSDTLLHGADARPIRWPAFNDADGLLVTLDVLDIGSGDYDGGDVRASLAFVPKSD